MTNFGTLNHLFQIVITMFCQVHELIMNSTTVRFKISPLIRSNTCITYCFQNISYVSWNQNKYFQSYGFWLKKLKLKNVIAKEYRVFLKKNGQFLARLRWLITMAQNWLIFDLYQGELKRFWKFYKILE